ncbi:hypothetical protein [uncultured Bacteroides sp.]|uniref:hypothetical protein n=1 Tax=uncultured Bacteroides sp. TaxID=162156 RepID=UPI002592823D|nr:hypothetical protein [uncultured Bacteroides sp.]
MIQATIILGESAVNLYENTGTLPSDQWLMDNGGIVDKIEFKTKGEYDAYTQALSDASGWNEYHVIRHEETLPEQPEASLWMRVGVTVKGSKADIEKILQGDSDTLSRLFETLSFDINGETYIPDTVVGEYNNENGTDFDEGDVNFHSISIPMNR